jgi:hypothetical protein
MPWHSGTSILPDFVATRLAPGILVAARRNQLSPESLEQANKDSSDLYAEVEASLREDPAGPKAQELADRWEKRMEDFTGWRCGDSSWPKSHDCRPSQRAARAASRATPEIEAFSQKAVETGTTNLSARTAYAAGGRGSSPAK